MAAVSFLNVCCSFIPPESANYVFLCFPFLHNLYWFSTAVHYAGRLNIPMGGTFDFDHYLITLADRIPFYCLQ